MIQAIRPWRPDEAARGQCGTGKEADADVAGSRSEPSVAAGSKPEVYVVPKVSIENWRWAGVPFYLRTDKRLAGRCTEISIHYKPAPYRTFHDTLVERLTPNVIRLLIDPEQGILTQFDAKIPGPHMRLGRVETRMHYKDFFGERPNVGYETLLYDCMTGDPTLFQRADATEASWAAVQPLLDMWSKGESRAEAYPAGSQGAQGTDALLARDGHKWLPLDP